MSRGRRGTQWSRPLVTLPVLAAALAGAAFNRNGHAEPALPNIVLVLADDMGYGDVGVYNSGSCIPTAKMDGLASEGIGFTDMHSTD